MVLHSVAWKLKDGNTVVTNKEILKSSNYKIKDNDFECVSLILSEDDIRSLTKDYRNINNY